jgi:tripartite-type tricarboxylate transporter receptor subunit TctC
MFKHLAYDPAKDFSPIIRGITTAMVLLVKPDFPAKDLAQFLEYARAHKGLTGGYGSGASQISVAQLKSRGGLSLVPVSYRGVPLAMTDVISGAIDLTFADFSVAIPQMNGGTLRGIGVTSPTRSELLPDLPALAEAMPGFEAVGPARTRQYARADREQALRGKRKVPVGAGGQGATRQGRCHGRDPDAGRVRRLHQERDRPLDCGLRGSRDRAAMMDHSGAAI